MSSQDLKSTLKRLDRLADIRRTFVVAAEGRLAAAHHQVSILEDSAEAVARKITQAQEEMAYMARATGEQLQGSEKFIALLRGQAERIKQDLLMAKASLKVKEAEWTEALREKKPVERIHERRLREWQRQDNAETQKKSDVDSVMQHRRRRADA